MTRTSVWLLVALAVRLASAEEPARPGINLALGQAVHFGTPPNYPATTDPDDARQLVDGKLSPAEPIWYDPIIVGWVLVDPTVFTIDLGRVQPIRGVGLHLGAGQAGVEWPTSIQVYVSDEGDRYSHVGNLMDLLVNRPPEKGYAAFWLITDKLATHGRFVRFVCSPVNLGNGAYIMVDEAEVYQGEPAWLARPLVYPEAPAQYRADWAALRWRDQAAATPLAERPATLRLVDGAAVELALPGQSALRLSDGVWFPLGGEAGRNRSMSWTAELPQPISTTNCRHAVLTFQAEGIRRTYDRQALVALEGVNDQSAANQVVLLEANLALNDGRSHTLVKTLPDGFNCHRLKVAVVTASDHAGLRLARLELLAAPPEVYSSEIATEPARQPYLPVALGQALNGSLAGWHERVMGKYGVALDGARALPAGDVTVSGVPFRIAAGEQNLAIVPESPVKNERITFRGQVVDSRNLGPISRDDSLGLEVDAAAREAYLLLALAAPPIQVRGGLPDAPLLLDDIECLSVELAYDRGRNELAFPYSLADQGFCLPDRELGAYAVAVDPSRRLKRITLHARQFGLGFGLAALTLNTVEGSLVPRIPSGPAPEAAPRLDAPPARPPAVALDGRRLTVGNRWSEVVFDLEQGFRIDRFVHRGNPAADVWLSVDSGLRVRIGETSYTGRCFRAEVLKTTAASAELRLTSTRPELPLSLTVTITAHDSPELALAVKASNTGGQPLAAEVCLPYLRNLTIGRADGMRVFFPQYRAVDTGDRVALRAPYGPEFSCQFMDVYNRAAGIGLMFRTDNRDQQMAEFALAKDTTVAGGVWFPAELQPLQPGVERSYPTVSLLAHPGDWHAAFELYRDWLRSWYRPVKSQDEDWFLKAWDLQVYRPSEKVSWREARVPALCSPDRKRFFVDETFALEQRRIGHVPDLIHFFNWTYDDRRDRDTYGVWGTPLAYEQVGGLDLLRSTIAEIQDKWQRPVSLYTLPDRFRASALPDPKLAQELAAGAVYKMIENDPSAALRGAGFVEGVFFPGIGNPKWTDFFIADIAKMQRDTGCKMVYLDVFPRFSHLRGAPGVTPREDDLNVVRRMREALPDEVALWTEYPFTDVASQYADGCLTYYFLELNETFARRYNESARPDPFIEPPLNLMRFALPRYRMFTLPVYIEASNKPSQVDAAFFNGEPFHEDTFRLHHSRLQHKINRSYQVKHQYPDCFGSDHPMPRVPTAIEGIWANLFPGRNRNLWTLYNGRPKTYSGVVLQVPHHPGASYRDAWNDQPLMPEIVNGRAYITLTIDPQQPGCVVQEWGGR